MRKSAQEWEQKYNDAIAEHKKQMEELVFDGVLKDAIATAKGRSDKAIRALLDVDVLRKSKNQSDDIKAALEGLRKENGFLFDDGQTPPFAPSTGTGPGGAYDSDTAMRAAMGFPASEKK